MKRNKIFFALFLGTFIFLFFGNISNLKAERIVEPPHHDPNVSPPSTMPSGNEPPPRTMPGSNEPMYGGPNDHHCPPGTTCGGPNDNHGEDCAALPTPDEVAACWDTKSKNRPGGPHGDPCMAVPAGPDRAACHASRPGPGHHDPNMAPPSGPNHPPGPGGPNDHHDGPNDHPDCPAGTTCDGPNDHHGDQDAAHCRAMGMADGSPHVDPPQNILDQVQAEYEANCRSGNCFLGEGNYKLLEDMGHTRAKVDCFLAEGHREHDEQHGGPGGDHHPPAP